MKKKIISLLVVLAMLVASFAVMAGCGTETENEAADTAEEKEEETTLANPWTESDKEGVAEATGFDIDAPEGATNVTYSYMSEGSMAQLQYELDGAKWVYRIQMADELTDISGLSITWDSKTEGTVAGKEAIYYSYTNLNDDTVEDVQLVNWYEAVAGVTYSLSATGTDLNGIDLQVIAENIYSPAQSEAYGDEDAEVETEINDYFIGEHKRSEDESTLTISDNNDGTYKIDISVVRLCSLEDGVGTFADHKMTFEVQDPSDGTMYGVIYRDNDNSLTVKITDSTWDMLPTDEVLEGFGR